MRVQHHP